MKTVYSEQVLVRVWRNLKTLCNLPTLHFGHASATLAGNTVPGKKEHISFWPASGVENRLGAFKKQLGGATEDAQDDRIAEMKTLTAIRLEVGYCKHHGLVYPPQWDRVLINANKRPIAEGKLKDGQKRLTDDDGNIATQENEDGIIVPLYSQSPQVKFYLPGLFARGQFWGLNLTRMAAWWKDFMKTGPQYKAFGMQNCAGVVLMALEEGGSKAIAEAPVIRAYGEPRQVEQYALELSMQFERLDSWTRRLDNDVKLNGRAGPVKDLKDGLWTVEAWKRASALGIFSSRSDAIQEIDLALEKFQRYDWKLDFLKRYQAFVELFLAVAKHREKKADSQRTEAVLQLGSQIVTVLEHHKFYAH